MTFSFLTLHKGSGPARVWHRNTHSAFQSLLKDMYAVSDDTPVLFTSYFATGGALDYYGG
jgi:hypothetical protein